MLLSVDITPEMKAQLDAIKAQYGLSVSDVVRIMLTKQLAETTTISLSLQEATE